MSNMYLSNQNVNSDIDKLLRREYKDFNHFDLELKEKMRAVVERYNKIVNDTVHGYEKNNEDMTQFDTLCRNKCNELYYNMKAELDELVGNEKYLDADGVVDMLGRGESGRVFYKGTVGELVKALNSSIIKRESEKMVEINSVSDIETFDEKDSNDKGKSFAGRVYKPSNKSSDVTNDSDLNKMLLREHMRDLKRIDALTGVIEEYTAEIKELRSRLSYLESMMKKAM